MTLAFLIGLLGAFMVWASIVAGQSTQLWPVVLAANAFVLAVLIRTRKWFAAMAARRPNVPRASTLRRLGPWLAMATVSVAVVGVLASWLQVGGDDRPLRYLQGLPEYGLAFPGATLTSMNDTPQDSWFDAADLATTKHRYQAQAPVQEVTAWYSERLASGGWQRRDLNRSSPETDDTPQWKLAFAALQIWYAPTDPNGTTTFTIALLAEEMGIDWAPLGSLQALPAARIAYPGSTPGPSTDEGRTTSASRVRPAVLGRHLETSASIGEVVRYFETELAAQGWVPRTVTAPAVGWSWTKDASLLYLHANRIERRSPPVTSYRYRIEEILGPGPTPGLPWH